MLQYLYQQCTNISLHVPNWGKTRLCSNGTSSWSCYDVDFAYFGRPSPWTETHLLFKFASSATEASESFPIVLSDVCKHFLILDVTNPSCPRAKWLPESLDSVHAKTATLTILITGVSRSKDVVALPEVHVLLYRISGAIKSHWNINEKCSRYRNNCIVFFFVSNMVQLWESSNRYDLLWPVISIVHWTHLLKPVEIFAKRILCRNR